jgi:hypothetical protein
MTFSIPHQQAFFDPIPAPDPWATPCNKPTNGDNESIIAGRLKFQNTSTKIQTSPNTKIQNLKRNYL